MEGGHHHEHAVALMEFVQTFGAGRGELLCLAAPAGDPVVSYDYGFGQSCGS